VILILAIGLSYSEIGKRLSSCANMGNVNTGPTEVPRPRHGGHEWVLFGAWVAPVGQRNLEFALYLHDFRKLVVANRVA
jgi:hypothetical protein